MVKAVLPTPPSPSTTNLYRVIFPAILTMVQSAFTVQERQKRTAGLGRSYEDGAVSRGPAS